MRGVLVIFYFFSFLTQKMLKMKISTSVWGAQHPNPGQNMQQILILTCPIFRPVFRQILNLVQCWISGTWFKGLFSKVEIVFAIERNNNSEYGYFRNCFSILKFSSANLKGGITFLPYILKPYFVTKHLNVQPWWLGGRAVV